MKHLFIILMVGLTGCLDLDLLDEVRAEDTDSALTEQLSSGWLGSGSAIIPDLNPDDHEPPVLIAGGCAPLEELREASCIAVGPGGAAVRFETDEPARIEHTHTQLAILSADYVTRHGVLVGGLQSGTTDVELSVTDVNENTTTVTLTLTGQPGLPIALTEVLYDPNGPEPHQEFVEVSNYGAEALDLSGWMIDDNGDQDGDLLPDGTILEAGEVGLLVSPDYDGSEGSDPSPTADTLIVRLESSIATSGLKNSEPEDLVLYDAAGNAISALNGPADSLPEGNSFERAHAALPDGALWGFAPSAVGPTPGATAFFD